MMEGRTVPFGQSHQPIWKWLLCCAEAVAAQTQKLNVDTEQSWTLPEGLVQNSYQTTQNINFRLFTSETMLFIFSFLS